MSFDKFHYLYDIFSNLYMDSSKRYHKFINLSISHISKYKIFNSSCLNELSSIYKDLRLIELIMREIRNFYYISKILYNK